MPNPWFAFLKLSNFEAAWEKVADNHGCAGVDGETIEQFGRKVETYLPVLFKSVQQGTYHPLPLKQLYIPKKGEGWRSLAIPTVRDRIVQQALLNVLHPALEPQFEACSYAYRPQRSYQQAVRLVSYWRDQGYEWVLDADIVEYFGQVQHERLLAELRERLPNQKIAALIEDWLRVGIYTKWGITIPQRGLAQGSVVSPILANVYLDDFDEAILETKLKLVRFSDDFLILGKTEQQIQAAQGQVGDLLGQMGLQLHPEKTQITTFDRGFRFLGHVFAGDLVLPSKKGKSTQKNPGQAKPTPPAHLESSPPERLIYVEPPGPHSPNLFQLAFQEAILASTQPIPPPLYVVMGYGIRNDRPVVIKSNEVVWLTGMSTLYLVHQQSTVRKDHGRLIVQCPEVADVEIPIKEVERILVFGNIQLTTSVISACLDAQIPVMFLTQLGDYKGHLGSGEVCDLESQTRQFVLRSDSAFQLEMAIHLVWGKVRNARQLLLRGNRRRDLPEIDAAIARLKEIVKSIETAKSLERLRGLEGNAAKLYFKSLGLLLIDPGFTLTERTRRPPKDPVNSLLSFGYTLVFHNVLSLILAEGLNPYLGNLHRSDRKEPHLAFDLMEEFRSPIVDSLVLMLVNKKILKPTDFTWPDAEGGIYLNEPARRVFLKHFEERMSEEVTYRDNPKPMSFRRVIQQQVQQYKYCLKERAAYEPFLRNN
jgi:CRISP-associated protein Cas1